MTENIRGTSGTKPAATDLLGEEQTRLLARIKRAVRRKTNGGVHKLVVEMQEETILLRGQCVSFYCKQVAQQAAMSYLSEGAQVQNEIEVGAAPR